MPTKIATAEDVQAELRTLLAMTEGGTPSRAKLAAALESLANRVAGVDSADSSLLKQLGKVVSETKTKLNDLTDFYRESASRLRNLQKGAAERTEPNTRMDPKTVSYFNALADIKAKSGQVQDGIERAIDEINLMDSMVEELHSLWV